MITRKNTAYAFSIGAALATGVYGTAAGAEEFNIKAGDKLAVETACSVTISPSQNNTTGVEIDGSPADAKKFKIYQQGDTIYVKEIGDACANTNSVIANGGDVIASGGSVVIGGNAGGNIIANGGSVAIGGSYNGGTIISGGGRIIVNGREISANTGSHNTRLPRITIKAPSDIGLDARLYGNSSLNSTVALGTTTLDLSGSTKAVLKARGLDIDSSGQTEVTASVNGGKLHVKLAGQGNVTTTGSFDAVSIELSGMGSTTTIGEVTGDYRIDASGMSKVSHRGPIKGRVKQNTSGMTTVNLGD